jgi:hypothetical protein
MLADRYRDYMYSLVRRVVDDIGPRPSCSEQERSLGRFLAEEWGAVCDRVDRETFTCSPSAFLGFIPFSAVLYIAAVIAYWFLPPVSFALAAIGFSMLFFEFLRYREFIDFLFPRRQGENIVGVVRPGREARQRVVVGAHMDSAYEFNLFYYLGNAAIAAMAIAMFAVLILLGSSLAKTVAYAFGSGDGAVFTVLGILSIALAPIVALFLFFHTYRAVPGAADDMAGIAVVCGLGKYLREAKDSGEWFPENTEVVLLATSSEEAGLRGSKRYVERHLDEMKATPAYGLFLEVIYDERFLKIASREICTGARHDRGLIRLAEQVAGRHGWALDVKLIPFGGTDASPFSLKGIPSVCVLCQDISRLVPNYHTRNDTYDHIRPQSLSVSLQLVLEMLKEIDMSPADLAGDGC